MVGSESLSVPELTGTALEAIGRIGRARFPREACGLLLPHPDALDRVVIELPNRSLNPEWEYQFTGDDAGMELAAGKWNHHDDVAIWHTHPHGSIGPSDQDIMRKLTDINYLVVALLDDGSNIPEWF